MPSMSLGSDPSTCKPPSVAIFIFKVGVLPSPVTLPDKPVPAVSVLTKSPVVSVPKATELDWIVKSPAKLIPISPLGLTNVGTLDPFTTKSCPLLGAFVIPKAPVPLPKIKLFVVNEPAPVPPLVTLRYCSPDNKLLPLQYAA